MFLVDLVVQSHWTIHNIRAHAVRTEQDNGANSEQRSLNRAGLLLAPGPETVTGSARQVYQ